MPPISKKEIKNIERERAKKMIALYLANDDAQESSKQTKKSKSTRKTKILKTNDDDELEALQNMLLERIKQRIGANLVQTQKKKKCKPELAKSISKKIRDLAPTKNEIVKITPSKLKTLREKMMNALDEIGDYGTKCIEGFRPLPTVLSQIELKPVNYIPEHWDISGIPEDDINEAEFARTKAMITSRAMKHAVSRGERPRLNEGPLPPLRKSGGKKKKIIPTLVL